MLSLLLVAAACEPAALLGALAKRDAVRCELTQTKKSKLFKKALESKGTIAAKASGAFRFETKTPAPSTLIVAGGRAIFESSSGREVLSLEKLPKVSAFLSAFSGLFTGRADALLARFSAKAECSGAKSSVALQPKDATFADISALTLVLEGDVLTRILLEEKNGDASELVLSGCSDQGVSDKLFEAP